MLLSRIFLLFKKVVASPPSCRIFCVTHRLLNADAPEISENRPLAYTGFRDADALTTGRTEMVLH